MANGKRWVLMTFLGWLIGFVLVLCLSVLFDGMGLEGFQFILGAGMGAGVSFMQWRLLKQQGMDLRWVWFAVIGLSLPLLVYDLLDELGIYHQDGNTIVRVCIALGGLLAGILQYTLFKTEHNRLWIAASLLGWSLAGMVVFAMDYTTRLSASNLIIFLINLLCILGGGVVLGWITEWFLRRIL